MNEKESQRTHAIYLDRDPVGNPRISVTLARRGRRGAGKRIKSITGRDRDVAFPHLSTIMWNHHGKRLETEAMDLPPGEYHPISEVAATQNAAPDGRGEGRGKDRTCPEVGRRHRRHAQLRGKLVVGLPSEPEPAQEGNSGPVVDVRVTDFRRTLLPYAFGVTANQDNPNFLRRKERRRPNRKQR